MRENKESLKSLLLPGIRQRGHTHGHTHTCVWPCVRSSMHALSSRMKAVKNEKKPLDRRDEPPWRFTPGAMLGWMSRRWQRVTCPWTASLLLVCSLTLACAVFNAQIMSPPQTVGLYHRFIVCIAYQSHHWLKMAAIKGNHSCMTKGAGGKKAWWP